MIPDTGTAPKMLEQPQRLDMVYSVPIDTVHPAQENEAIYQGFDLSNGDDGALYESVKRHGILEPLAVSMDGYILSGHRRHSAAVSAKLGHVPIRRVDIRLSDLSPAERLRILAEHNTQRRKGTEEQAREEIVRASPEDAYRALPERLQEQAQSFHLPPNTDAKTSSPQFKKFFARHGMSSAYELEALSPDVLAGIIRETIESVIDMQAYRNEVDTWMQEAAELDVIRRRVVAAVTGK